jgi:hypothetical protein
LYYERVPTIVILASGLAASAAAVLLGGPRTGYLPGIVISTTAVLVIVWRYDPSVHLRWLAAALLVAYHGGGTLIIRSNVLAHMSVGNDAVRYDRGLHVLGGILIVLLVAETTNERRSTRVSVVVTVAVAVGLLVEAVELLHAVALPRVFSYDLVDSSLDVVGNTAGFALGLAALLWTQRGVRTVR